MIIPVEWLKEYIKTDMSAKEMAQSFTALGLLLDKPIFKYTNNGYGTEVLDLEHRMDRSDWLCITGCARDLAAMEGLELNMPKRYTEPGKPALNEGEGGVKIQVDCPDLVHRFNTRVFRGIKVGPSPDWLKNRLESYGIPSKNNIVDITNYVMVELGQPMHAQDIDAMEKPEIIIRRAKNGEKVTTLLGETVELDETMFVLTQNDKPTVIGGVVGGASTGVTEKTVNIVLDSGNYDQTNIRRTSRKLKIQNETVLRYDKFLHPKNSQIAIERATKLILELAGGEYYENYDYYPNPWPQKQMALRLSRVEKISGVKFELERVKDILSRLEYKILEETPATDSDQASLKLEIPHFRTDIEVEDDIVADVLRINNYNKLPTAQINAVPPTDITPKIYVFEDKLRDACVNLGMHEHITTPLVKATSDDPQQVLLENALNSEQNALRTQLYDGLYDVARTYNKHNITNVALFEVGIKYTQNGAKADYNSYNETRVLQVYIHTDTEPLQTSYTTKQYLAGLFNELGITNVTHVQKDQNTATIKQNDTILGELKYDSFFLYTQKLMEAQKAQNRVKTEFTNVSSQDITIIMNIETPAGETFNKLTSLDENIDRVEVVGEYFESDKKSVTFRIFYTNKGNIEDKIAEFKNNSN